MTELLNCPFCGGSVSFAPYKNNGLKIECKPCTISYQQRTLRYGLDWLEGKMTEHWNRRAHLGCESCDGGMIDCYVCPLCAAASARPIGEDAANVAIGEREALLSELYYIARENSKRNFLDVARAALTAEKGQEPCEHEWLPMTEPQKECVRCGDVRIDRAAAPQQTAQPVAQTLALTDEQIEDLQEAREILENMVRSVELDGNYSTEATCTFLRQALLCLPAAQTASSLAEGDKQ